MTIIIMQVQLVIELVAASHPIVMAEESFVYRESSFRTASYVCRGTVFNPHLERAVRKIPVPPPPSAPLHEQVQARTSFCDEKTSLLGEKQENIDAETPQSIWAWLCCR